MSEISTAIGHNESGGGTKKGTEMEKGGGESGGHQVWLAVCGMRGREGKRWVD